jgi:hypothetical protein
MTEETVFETALAKATPAERSAYLEEVCAGDAALRQRVEALLQAHEKAGDFLEQPAVARIAAAGEPAHDDSKATGSPRGGDEAAGPARPGDSLDQTLAERSDGGAAGEPLDFLDPSERPGSLGRLGHYEVLEVVGRGGMGVVLKAYDESLHRVVAIKVMAAPLASSATARKRFIREARAAAAICHDHVITIHSVEEAKGLPYIVMQYVAGLSLQEKIDAAGPLELKEILRVGMQTAAGLAAAHAQGLIHRDIKPANILLENGVERVKITDFGLARAVDDASLSSSGVIAGTPQYMAPEQARGETVDHRADLFSLGSVLYLLCTGRSPFRASGALAALNRVCEDTPRPVQWVNPEVPDWLAKIIVKLHAKDAAARFQSAKEVADLLGQRLTQLQQPGQVPMPESIDGRLSAARPPTTKKRARVIFAGVLLLVLAGLTLAGLALSGLFRTAGPAPMPGANGPEAGHAGKGDRPTPGPQPFRILARGEEAPQQFTSLKDAVEAAWSGDTIEICGDGPFVSPPIVINDRPLTIRAAAGFRPVIELSPEGVEQNAFLIHATNAPLVLEGLDCRYTGAKRYEEGVTPGVSIVCASGAPLHVANCRFLLSRREDPQYGLESIILDRSPACECRNCLFVVGKGSGMAWWPSAQATLALDNCLFAGDSGASVGGWGRPDEGQPSVRLRHNTFGVGCTLVLWSSKELGRAAESASDKRLRVEAVENVMGYAGLLFNQVSGDKLLSAAEMEALLQRLVDWRDENNLYSQAGGDLLVLTLNHQPIPQARAPKSLADWNEFWQLTGTGSRQGLIQRKGGDIWATMARTPERVSPEDFRLVRGTPGQGQGSGGRDLGADVDLVGPGAAYERWKETPEYQQWLRDAGLVRGEK